MAKKKTSKSSRPSDTVLPGGEPAPKLTLFAWLRARFFAGVVIAAPIAISVGAVYWFITVIDGWLRPLLPPILKPETYTKFAIPGFGLLVAVIGLTLLGVIATNLIGRATVSLTDRVLSRVPVVSNIYSAFKQLFDILAANKETSFKEVVLVEYPKRDTWCIGFVTARPRGEVRDRLGDDYTGVFVPTTPNPTSGFLMYIPNSEILHLGMTIEDGAKMIISAGLVVPEREADTVVERAENAISGAKRKASDETAPAEG